MNRSYLRELRLKSGLSQKCVAGALGITRQYYQMIETGRRLGKMDAVLLFRLAELFDAEVGYLLENERKGGNAGGLGRGQGSGDKEGRGGLQGCGEKSSRPNERKGGNAGGLGRGQGSGDEEGRGGLQGCGEKSSRPNERKGGNAGGLGRPRERKKCMGVSSEEGGTEGDSGRERRGGTEGDSGRERRGGNEGDSGRERRGGNGGDSGAALPYRLGHAGLGHKQRIAQKLSHNLYTRKEH